MFIDELQSIYQPFIMYYKDQLQLLQQLLNKFYKHLTY